MKNEYSVKIHNCEICESENIPIIQDIIDIGNGKFGKLPVNGCTNCGYIFQSERFEEKFYRDFYEKNYRSILFGKFSPEKQFIKDQIYRGNTLYENVKKYILSNGNLLDVGCSSGGLMIAFKNNGWNVHGTDPDVGYVKFGKEVLKLNIDCMYAEDMEISKGTIDLIIITGSLEHVYDLKVVLEKCRIMSSPNAIIIVEGRALGFCTNQGYFTHTHRRYFDENTISLALKKYGWEPLVVTNEQLSGPTRPGGIFCIAKVCDIPTEKEFSLNLKYNYTSILKRHKQIKKLTSLIKKKETN
jgi:hypothetical protein